MPTLPALYRLPQTGDAELDRFLASVKQLLEAAVGIGGDFGSRFLTGSDLMRYHQGGLLPPGARGYPNARPHPPENMQIVIRGADIIISWTWPNDPIASHLEVWRAEFTQDITQATMIGIVTKPVAEFVDQGAAQANHLYYYWIRIISFGGIPSTWVPADGTYPVNTTLPMLTGLTVTGAFASIILSWDPLDHPMAAGVHIYRAPANDYGQAVLVGQTANSATVPGVFADVPPQANLAVVYYYWIRVVSHLGEEGPLNAPDGTPGSTAADPEYVLEVLTGQIKESQLYQDLNSRINLIDGPSSLPGSVAAGLLAEAQSRGAAITAETETRQTADESLAQSIATLSSSVSGNAAAIQTEQIARSTVDSALASQIATMGSTVAGNTASIQEQQTSIDGLELQYTMKFDNNGFMSGWGLASTPRDGTPFSEFYAMADRFAFINPAVNPKTVTQITRSGSTATATCSSHGFATNDYVVHTGAAQREYNGSHKITVTGTNTYTFPVTGTPDSPATLQTGFPAIKVASAVMPLVIQDGQAVFNFILAADASIKSAMVESLAADKLFAASGTIAQALIGSADITSAMVADAAITNAKIGTAAVDTLTVAGNAITAPVIATTAGIFYSEQYWQTIQQATITAIGGQMLIIASALVTSEAMENDNGYDLHPVAVRLLRGATEIVKPHWLIDSGGAGVTGFDAIKWLSLAFADQPGAGSHTYYLQIFGGGNYHTWAEQRTLYLLEIKR